MKLFNSNNSRDSGSKLEGLIRAGREASTERLSAGARSAILDEALKPAISEGPPALFTPTRHILVAGALPVVLAVALLVGSDPGVQPPPAGVDAAPEVTVSKVGGRVLFAIRNGGKPHTVYRTTDPRGSGAGERITGGEYVDRLQDQDDLVFYRID